MNVLSNNQKAGKSLNLPAPETCKADCPLMAVCYAQKGRFVFQGVKAANQARLDLYKAGPGAYFERLDQELQASRLTHIRIFASGDCPDQAFATHLIEVLAKNRDKRFWLSTRKPEFFPRTPKNVVVRVSHGIDGANVSRVTADVAKATCPATMGKAADCQECGHKCWSRRVKTVVYLKH
jgi:hypothetical protein